MSSELAGIATSGIERVSAALKGVLPKEYARPALDKTRLGQLIDLVSNISFIDPTSSNGEKQGGAQHAHDLLGRVYEYFLS